MTTGISLSQQAQLTQSLRAPACYPHPVTEVELMETHISYVLLAGDYAYKIKKNVNFGFLDFSTLDKRKFCCEEELRLNRRQAADLYLEVIPITGTPAQPTLSGDGDIIEYAVKMRRFSQESLLDSRLKKGEITPKDVDALADALVAFHGAVAQTTQTTQATQAAQTSRFGSADEITRYTQENVRIVTPLLTDAIDQERLTFYSTWMAHQHQHLATLFAQRKQQGFIRECHGDLHLRNIIFDQGGIHFFDCIEFNPSLRWIDVISELAFLAMDLEAAGYPQFSRRLINRYFELTGDYAGVPLLHYYLAYRAMVRAKVALLRLPQAAADTERATLRQSCSDYVHLAWRYATAHAPALIVTHGLSGSGKSTHTSTLVGLLGALRLRSDVERKRLHEQEAHTPNAIDSGIYSQEATHTTYAHLLTTAELILAAGFPVIIDATCLKRWQRDLFRETAARKGIAFALVDFPVNIAELERRIQHRQAHETDASEATLTVLHQQIAAQEPLSDDEQKNLFSFTVSAASKDLSLTWQPLLRYLNVTHAAHEPRKISQNAVHSDC